MTERQLNERRNWKAMAFPYDTFIPDESQECQYCLTDKQATYLRGLLEPAGWKTRWWSEENEIDQDKIEEFRDDLIRRLMMSCCGDENPILYRYTTDGVLQHSTDGGTTWEDAPQQDPRNNSTVFPPVAGDDGPDKRCVAATGMVALIKSQVSGNLTDDMSSYTLAQLLHDWVNTVIQTGNPFQALLTIAANQIFALVISALRTALTDDVYDTLLCIFDCNMSTDASFNETQVEQVRTDIGDQISGLPTLFLQQLVFLLGPVGMTNLARAGGATTGDCSACPCEDSCAAHFTDTQGIGTIIDSGAGFVTLQSAFFTSPFSFNMARVVSDLSSGSCCTVTAIELLSGSSYGTASGFTDTFPAGQTIPPTIGADYCGFQFELDGAEAPFTVKISFLT